MKAAKLKTLAAGVLLALSAGGAHAAISNGLPAGSTPAVAPGELFLMVWDQDGQQSFSQDLGYTLESVLATVKAGNPLESKSWNLGASFQTFAATNPGNTLYYAIEAANTYGGIGSTSDAPQNWKYGVAGSGLAGVDLVGADNRSSTVIPTWASKIGSNATYLNQAAVAYNGGVYSPATGGDYAANLSEITTDTGAPWYYDNLNGSPGDTNLPWEEFGIAGSDSLSLYFIGLNPTNRLKTVAYDLGLSRNFQFNLNPVAGTLTWDATAPVPVPAAVWLMLSALGSLGIIGRRQRKPA
ncbi:VPLPA-CTERM sorting domain-containing protein [Methylococcus sp. EFPC2]|uniref:VPLPA-CTERM sorting domain-containing protein n=1 Tax=Methylococcus sp. EFPC2 TaxID=2812648 RepID=UPI001966D2E1|nr:VPLPA-CTERM sorting domain-containing protein [Methylococcus sp. EFPC2]QSA98564.1 VPLPA-CTERM sorting domain-containing protein [Methylococcus sp. EFPC2]